MNRDSLPGPRWLKQCWTECRPQQLFAGSLELIWVEAETEPGTLSPVNPLQAALADLRERLPHSSPETLLGISKTTLDLVPGPAVRYCRRRWALRQGELVAWPDPGPFDWASFDHGVLASAELLTRLRDLGQPVRLPQDGLSLAWQQARRYPVVLVQRDETLQIHLDPMESQPLSAPTLEIPQVAAAAFPELHSPPRIENLQAAWQSWAASRNIPTEWQVLEPIHYQAGTLQVELTPPLRSWLETHRSDVFTADIWVWIPHGELHVAARFQFH